MPFNVGGFNKVLSRAGVQTMGAAPRINQKLETSAAAQGLRNQAKIRAAEYGAQMMADQASAQRSADRSSAIFGAIGNVIWQWPKCWHRKYVRSTGLLEQSIRESIVYAV